MSDEFYSFADTAAKLGISEDELTDLVSNEVLPMHREGRKMKFKAADVEDYLAQAGGAESVADDESRIIEIDEIPDDIELVADGNGAAATEAAELDALDDFTVAETNDAIEDSPLTFAEPSAAEVAEEVTPLSAADDFAVVEEPGEEITEAPLTMDEEITVEEPTALDDSYLADEPSDLEMVGSPALDEAATMAIDEEPLAEEIVEEMPTEDDMEMNTQDITLQEAAITEDEIADTDATLAVDDEGLTEEVPTSRTSARGSARSRSSLSSRMRGAATPEEAMADKLAMVWLAAMAALVILMLYPAVLLGSLVFYGVADYRETLTPGKQKISGIEGFARDPLLNVGKPVVPKAFAWIEDKKIHQWFGVRKTEGKSGFDKFVPYEEREKMGLLKIEDATTTPPAATQPDSGEEPAPDNGDENNNDDGGGEAPEAEE